jgi:iron complex outermembrane receptor protein
MVRTFVQSRVLTAVLVCLSLGAAAQAQDAVAISGTITTRVDAALVAGAVVAVAVADVQRFAAKWLTDVQASLRRGGYAVAAGVQNLFDVFPDRNSTVNSFNGIQTFPSQSPFGFNGRSLYARLAWTF